MGGTRALRATTRRVGVLALAVCVLVSGCLGAGGGDAAPTPTPTGTKSQTPTATPTPTPALESVLVQYLDADNRTAFARDHDIRTRDGAVLVVVELRSERTLPDGYDVAVESRHGRTVEAYVAATDLRPLAAHENVSFVRTPHALQASSLEL